MERGDLGLEQLVEDADAAGLDDHVGAPGLLDEPPGLRGVGAGIDDDAGPRQVLDVAVLLAIVGVRLVEGDRGALARARARRMPR